MFGRGAEEVLHLVENGIPWEVVPGVTSATAVPAYAGIPITHREFSSMASIITGHETFKKELTRVRYDLIGPTDSTLVILMGMTNLHAITRELISAGRPLRPRPASLRGARTRSSRFSRERSPTSRSEKTRQDCSRRESWSSGKW